MASAPHKLITSISILQVHINFHGFITEKTVDRSDHYALSPKQIAWVSREAFDAGNQCGTIRLIDGWLNRFKTLTKT